MDSDGTDQIRLTNNANNLQDQHPAWSPDGTRISFVSDRTGTWQIYSMNPDGSNLSQITNNATADVHPVWSPGGDKIAFYRSPGFDIYVIDADGSNEIGLTSGAINIWPGWSPDGSKIVFESNRDGVIV